MSPCSALALADAWAWFSPAGRRWGEARTIAAKASPSLGPMIVLVAAVALFVAGCTHSVDARLTQPIAVEKLPVTVGVWFPAELRADQPSPSTDDSDYLVGSASVALFRQVFAGLFRDTVELSEPTPTSPREPLNGIIELRLTLFRTDSYGYNAKASYEVVLRSTSGEPVAEFRPHGEGKTPALALRAAASNFVVEFSSNPSVARWAADFGSAIRPSPIAEGPSGGVVVLSRARRSDSIADCVADALRERGPIPPVITARDWRAALFPWFEPDTAPTSVEDLPTLLARPVVRERVTAMGARYLAWIEGATTEGELEGPLIPAVAGVGWYDKRTKMGAQLWDLASRTSLGEIPVTVSHTAVILDWVFLFLPLIPATEGPACAQLAQRIAAVVTAGAGDSQPLPAPSKVPVRFDF